MIWNFENLEEKSQVKEYLEKLIQEFNEEFVGKIEIYKISTGIQKYITSEFYIRVPSLKYTMEIFNIAQEITNEYPIKIKNLIGDIWDQEKMCNNFEEFKESIEEITQSEEMNNILKRLNSMI